MTAGKAASGRAPASLAAAGRNISRRAEGQVGSASAADDQKGADSAGMNPKATDPEATDPEATDPEATDPEGTDPGRAGPEGTDPGRAGPERAGQPVREPGRGDLVRRDSAPLAARDDLLPARPASASFGEPSWAAVIATTFRLWLHRRVLRDQRVPAQRRPAWRRRARVLALLVVVFAAGALTIALTVGRPGSATNAGREAAARKTHAVHSAPPSPASLAAAAASRQAAASWIVAEVSHSVMVSCDPVMCAELMARGFPSGDLLPLSASATDPMGSQVVVATTALRSQFGSRLADVYAPVVMASFGTGTAEVDVRIEAADGSQAYLVAQRADLLARVTAGQQLLKNKELHVSGSSRQAIADGYVDPRLLITLVGLLAQEHQVVISGFGDAGPGTAGGTLAAVPLRTVRIAGLVAARGKHREAYLSSALKFLQAQQEPYRASLSVLHPRGKAVIQIHFTAPTPLGLLGAGTSP